MPAEIESAVFCADYWSTFEVTSKTEYGRTYSVTFGGGEGPAFCSCPAFKYAPEDNRTCKHITYVFEHGCFWNPQWYEGGDKTIRPIQVTSNIADGQECPHCGGPVVPVRIAV